MRPGAMRDDHGDRAAKAPTTRSPGARPDPRRDPSGSPVAPPLRCRLDRDRRRAADQLRRGPSGRRRQGQRRRAPQGRRPLVDRRSCGRLSRRCRRGLGARRPRHGTGRGSVPRRSASLGLGPSPDGVVGDPPLRLDRVLRDVDPLGHARRARGGTRAGDHRSGGHGGMRVRGLRRGGGPCPRAATRIARRAGRGGSGGGSARPPRSEGARLVRVLGG